MMAAATEHQVVCRMLVVAAAAEDTEAMQRQWKLATVYAALHRGGSSGGLWSWWGDEATLAEDQP